jgi:hypothetical protein
MLPTCDPPRSPSEQMDIRPGRPWSNVHLLAAKAAKAAKASKAAKAAKASRYGDAEVPVAGYLR